MRRLPTLTREAFDLAIAVAIEAVTASDLRGWIEHAGYVIDPV